MNISVRHINASRDGRQGRGIVVVGAGLAGLFTALKLAPLPVTVISPAPFGEGASSLWAQAGIAAALAEGDSPEAHAADTVKAGAGLVDERIALLMAREARERVEDLLAYGVPFDKDLEGHLSLGHEAAHRSRRILHVKGDTAGRAIMHTLTDAVRRTPSITVLEGHAARDLLVEDGRVAGIALAPVEGGPARGLIFDAAAVVLATGGAGQVFAVTTNPGEARGDGIAIAARAGAVIADAEFVQFHPTAINIGRDPAPLATEALRGEGAVLVNARGERFMRAVHEDAELAPRDVVARAVHRELACGRGAFLDCRPLGPLLAHFPTVSAICEAAGLDPAREPIPVAPAAHYHMGGILTDARGRSTVDGLWACGEVASTGAHGANRLASNSLLEAVVFGARVARDIAKMFPFATASAPRPAMPSFELGSASTEGAEQALRRIMSAEVGVMCDGESLARALSAISSLAAEAERNARFGNLLTTAKLIAVAALKRRESRGAHFRSDYPQANESLARRSFLTLAEAERALCEAQESRRPARTALHA